ncbi:MAG: hypothetical protein QOJ53_1320 [Sphingomonadales bacterium]|jgi:hypothetical protein|nr:hypothetical protein [Sphingomonadales bacterium]
MLAASLLFAAAPAAAQRFERAPGTVYHYCTARHDFPFLRAQGRQPVMATRIHGRVETQPWPDAGLERIDGGIEVYEDGSVRDLNLSWMQAGLMGWPYVWRPDIHPIYLIGKFRKIEGVDRAATNFEPGALELQIEILSERRLRKPLIFRLWRDDQAPGTLALGGEAVIPAWRRSANLTVFWRDLAAYAGGQQQLNYTLSEPARFPYNGVPRMEARGTLDLSIMPALLDAFRAAEAALMRRAANAAHDCQRLVEPEPTVDILAD